MKRAPVLIVAAFAIGACGSDNSGGPTPSTTSVNVVGSWAGTQTAVGTIVQTGERVTTTCTQIWAITSQSGGQFSGTWQSSGGSCAQAGGITGTIASSGVLGNVILSVTSGATPPPANGLTCSPSSSQAFTGIASTTAITLSASDRLRCSGLGQTFDVDRAITFAMTKR